MDKKGYDRIIINADDFGMTPGINQAVEKLNQQGRLTSVSIVSNMPWSAEALKYALDAPDLESGIHLNLTTGAPLSPPDQVPSLVTDSGEFYEIRPFLALFLAGRIQRSEIRKELILQIERYLDHSLPPQHIDSHMHFHALGSLGEMVTELAGRYNIPCVRNPDLSAFIVPPTGRARLVDRAIHKTRTSLLKTTVRMTTPKTIPLNKPGNRTEQLVYLRWFLRSGDDPLDKLRACPDFQGQSDLEIIAHPAVSDDVLPSLSKYVNGRQRELDFLGSDQYFRLVEGI